VAAVPCDLSLIDFSDIDVSLVGVAAYAGQMGFLVTCLLRVYQGIFQ